MSPRKEDEVNWRRAELSDTSCEISATSFPERRVLKFPLHNFSFPTASWIRNRIFPCVKSDVSNDVESATATATATAKVPWNLRKRRAACFSPGGNGGGRCPRGSPCRWMLGRDSPGRVELEIGGERERRKFSVSLSREEIEGDFYLFKGIKPPRRPQKRPRIVQRKLDDLFPGLFLEEVTLDSYN